MKKLIYICLLLLTSSSVFSQNSGFGGKRVLIKTDLLNGARSPLFSVSAELLLTRRFTLTGGYRITSGEYNQFYYANEYHEQGDYNYSGEYMETKLKDKATINSRALTIEARLYKGGVIPAPKGTFFYCAYNNGSVDVKGNYYKNLLEELPSSGSSSSSKSRNTYYAYEAKDVKVWGLEAGVGYQSFINKYITWGVKLGLNKTSFNYDEKWDPKVLSGVAKTYGPNLLRLDPLGLGEDESPLPFASNGKSEYKGNIGLSFYFQLGILLF